MARTGWVTQPVSPCLPVETWAWHRWKGGGAAGVWLGVMDSPTQHSALPLTAITPVGPRGLDYIIMWRHETRWSNMCTPVEGGGVQVDILEWPSRCCGEVYGHIHGNSFNI